VRSQRKSAREVITLKRDSAIAEKGPKRLTKLMEERQKDK
jgi:hypothetical protein